MFTVTDICQFFCCCLPPTTTWPHLICDVGRGILTVLCTIYTIYNCAQRYEQFLQVGRLYLALILLGLAPCLLSPCVSSVFMVFIILMFLLTSFSLPFSELSLVGLTLDLVD